MTTETLIFGMIGLLLLVTAINIIHTFQVQNSLLRLQKNYLEFLRQYKFFVDQTNECIADIEDDFDRLQTKEN